MGDGYTCPQCKGAKQLSAFVEYKDWSKSGAEILDCDLCGGTGRISGAQLIWLQDGRELRRARIRRGETIMDAAKRMGVTPAEVCNMEHGRANPERLKGSHDQH